MYRVGSSYERKIPVYKKEGDIYVKVGEITEEKARFYADDPDVIEVNAVCIVDEEPIEGEERKIHEFRIT